MGDAREPRALTDAVATTGLRYAVAAVNEGGELDADALFAQGYLDGAGPPGYLVHLLRDVLPCEDGGTNDWSLDDAYHVSRAQFAHGTWAAASLSTGYADPRNPYDVGRNVAWLINHIADPGSTAGWPTCWHVRNGP